jgi:hypothetical protein
MCVGCVGRGLSGGCGGVVAGVSVRLLPEVRCDEQRSRSGMTHIIYAPDSPVALCGYRCDETWWETDEDDPVDCAVCAELDRA